MEEYIYAFVALIVLLNGLFWSLACHETHCKFVKMLGVENCIPHYIHIIFGIVAYIIGVMIVQRKYLFSK
tara:strand:+ start:8092 stop:8301 length:210 start_codon:yes stop_codon:yes gene_type:complete